MIFFPDMNIQKHNCYIWIKIKKIVSSPSKGEFKGSAPFLNSHINWKEKLIALISPYSFLFSLHSTVDGCWRGTKAAVGLMCRNKPCSVYQRVQGNAVQGNKTRTFSTKETVTFKSTHFFYLRLLKPYSSFNEHMYEFCINIELWKSESVCLVPRVKPDLISIMFICLVSSC